jgi:hypothetical protein
MGGAGAVRTLRARLRAGARGAPAAARCPRHRLVQRMGRGFKRGTLATELSGAWMVGQLANWVAPDTKGCGERRSCPRPPSSATAAPIYAIPRQATTPPSKALAWDLIRCSRSTASGSSRPSSRRTPSRRCWPRRTIPSSTSRCPSWAASPRAAVARRRPAHRGTQVHKQNNFADEVVGTELDNVLDRGKDIARPRWPTPRACWHGAPTAEPRRTLRIRHALARPTPPVAPLGALRADQPVPGAVRGVRRVPAAGSRCGWPSTAGSPPAAWTPWTFVGLGNFTFALQDDWFWKSLKNTLWLALATGRAAAPGGHSAGGVHPQPRSSGCAMRWWARTSCPTSPPRWPSPSCSARCSPPTSG